MTIRSGRAASPHANGVFSTGVTMRQWTGTLSTNQAWRSELDDALGTSPTEEYPSADGVSGLVAADAPVAVVAKCRGSAGRSDRLA